MSRLKMQSFEINSLAVAIYAICAWPGNRAYVGSLDQLNRDFLSYEKTQVYGKRKLDSYREFVRFYNVVKAQYPQTVKEDLETDIGQVRFFSEQENKYFSILIGNGSEDVYESCFFVDRLASTNTEDSRTWRLILEYENQLIELLYDDALPDNTEFTCPTQDFFMKVWQAYDDLKSPELEAYFRDYSSRNEELYPLFSVRKGLPVFLPMMKEIFAEKIELAHDDADLEEVTKYVINERLVSNFSNRTKGSPDYLFDVDIRNSTDQVIVSKAIALFYNSKCIVVIPTARISRLRKEVNEGLVLKQSKIYGRATPNEVGHVNIAENSRITYQFIQVTEVSPNLETISLEDANFRREMTSKDFVGILNHAKSISDIVSFLDTYGPGNKTDMPTAYLASGYGGLFQFWQQMDHVIYEGANQVSLFVPSYVTANANIDFFKSFRNVFPFDGGPEFKNPFHWFVNNDILDGERNADLVLVGKGHDSQVNVYSNGTQYFLYCESASIVDDVTLNSVAVAQSFSEIIDGELRRHLRDLFNHTPKRYLKVIVTSSELFRQHANLNTIEQQYFRKLISNSANMQTAFVVPNWDKISEDNMDQSARVFENRLLEELLYGFDFSDPNGLKSAIRLDDQSKRTSGLVSLQVEYFIDPRFGFSVPDDTAFKEARHLIAEVISKQHVEPGHYSDGQAVRPLKMFINELRNKLIQLTGIYDKDLLLVRLMNFHASVLFTIQLHRERLKSFSESNTLEKSALKKFTERTISQREEFKQYQRVLEYLIEVTVRHGNRMGQSASDEELQTIIALGKWILDFQDIDTQVKFGAVDWVSVDIQDNGVVSLIPTLRASSISDEIMHAKYKFGDYEIRDQSIDHRFFDMFKDAFFADTGIDFSVMLTVLYFLYDNGQVSRFGKQDNIRICGSVITADRNTLAQLFQQHTKGTSDEFYQVLDFLTLDSSHLTDKYGYIPIWENKKRSNKFSAKPILLVDSKIEYTPISLFQLSRDWLNGAFNFTLPYQIGMNNTKLLLDKWKHEYESKIVSSVGELFPRDKFRVYTNQELFKMDKKANHPRDIGDYDVIAIDTEKHVVWIIEVKYLRLNQTAQENIDGQDEYFLSRKSKGNKFLRRVTYFSGHLDEIMHNLNHPGHFTLKSFFVANKVVRSQFKEFPFDILGFNELETIVKSDK